MDRKKLQMLSNAAVDVAIQTMQQREFPSGCFAVIGPVAGAILAAALAETNSADIKIALVGRDNA